MSTAFAGTLEQLFGKSPDDLEMKRFLLQLGEPQQIQLPLGEDSAYVTRKDLGFSLLFKDRSLVRNDAFAGLSPGVPVLTTCFFYADGHEGYKGFAQGLPRGLSFSLGRAEIHKLLGAPTRQQVGTKSGRVMNERWDWGDRMLHITYAKEQDRMNVVAFGIFQRF